MRQVPADWWLNWLLHAHTQLVEHQSLLNRINVFPVADADTGSNLAATLGHAADAAGAADEPTLNLAARAALRGARGNSGTLLAVWLLGLARTLGPASELPVTSTGNGELGSSPDRTLTSEHLARAFTVAATGARLALSQPAEGTMLTLMAALHQVKLKANWRVYSDDLVVASETALRATAHAEHARNGWVDSGALGFHLVLVSLVAQLMGAEPEPTYRDLLAEAPASLPLRAPEKPRKGEPQVEVMCEIHLPVFEVAQLRSALDAAGDSVSIAQIEDGNEALWAVHVHVPTAEDALALLRAAGEPQKVRITSLASPDHSHEE